ncbi:MAG: NUDIX hydrolase [Anaerolineales bacterium]
MADNFPEALRARLQARSTQVRAEWRARPAAVLTPLYLADGEWHLLFTQRTDTVEEHKGQVSFPGGSVDPEDRDRIDTALRETEEEIGLHRADVTVLGALDELITVMQWRITPVVATFTYPYEFKLNPAEATAVFGVPLRWLADPTNLETRYREPIVPGRKVAVYYYAPYDGYVIWGATARMTLSLLQVAGLIDHMD